MAFRGDISADFIARSTPGHSVPWAIKRSPVSSLSSSRSRRKSGQALVPIFVISAAVVLTISSSGCSPDPTGESTRGSVDSGPGDSSTLDVGGVDAPMGPLHKGLFQIIDDMEGGDPGAALPSFVSPVGLGSWFFSGPPSSSSPGLPVAEVAALDQPRGSSHRAWHVPVPAGGGRTSLFLDLHGPKFPAVPFGDLSAYAGIAFWSRGSLPSTQLVVALEDSSSARTDLHQALNGASPPWFAQEVKVGNEWQRHILLFDDLVALDKSKSKLDTTAFWSVNFIASSGSATDYWIDDLALICKGLCPLPPFDLEPSSAPDLNADSLQWTSGSVANSCGELASLTMDSLPKKVAVGEKVFLHARVRAAPEAEVPLWLWRGENTQTSEKAAWQPLDKGSSMAAMSFPSAGSYTVGAHSHYPGMETCSAETTITVVP